MERGKRVDIYSLIDEIIDFDNELKKAFLKLFEYIYFELDWSYQTPPRHRTMLYNKIEEIFGSELTK